MINPIDALKDSFAAARGSTALRRLGVVSVLNAAFAATLVIVVAVVLIGFASVAVEQPGITERIDAVLLDPSSLAGVLAVIAGLTLVSLGLAVFQVAAIGGLVTESDAVLRGDVASVRRGLRNGFGHFLRVATIWAVQVAPQLVLLMVEAVVLYFTVSVPLQAGAEPSPDVFALSQSLLTPLSLLASLATIPLHIIAMLSLRYALIDGLDLREALSAGLRLAKSRVADVAVIYLVLMLAGMVAGTVIGMLAVVIISVLAASTAVAVGAMGSSGGIIVALLICVATVPVGVLLGGWYSAFLAAVWTHAWRLLTTPVEGVSSGHAVTEGASS